MTLYHLWNPLAWLSLMKNVCERTWPLCSSPKNIGPSRPGQTWKNQWQVYEYDKIQVRDAWHNNWQAQMIGPLIEIYLWQQYGLCSMPRYSQFHTFVYIFYFIWLIKIIHLTAETPYTGLTHHRKHLRMMRILAADVTHFGFMVIADEPCLPS